MAKPAPLLSTLFVGLGGTCTAAMFYAKSQIAWNEIGYWFFTGIRLFSLLVMSCPLSISLKIESRYAIMLATLEIKKTIAKRIDTPEVGSEQN